MKILGTVGKTLAKKTMKYSSKTLGTGVFQSGTRKAVMMKSVCTAEDTAKVPLACFSRTKDGEIILYRGLKTYGENYNKSVAAACGATRKNILATHGASKEELVQRYTALTQHSDPILHTTTKRRIARTFAGDNGAIVVYRVPQAYLEKMGYVGHIGENEISFFHSLPKKFVHKVLYTKPTKQIEETGLSAQLPKSINLVI